MFSRNYIFITNESQIKASKSRILLIGCGLGSQIATLLVRTGFINFTIADGDNVEEPNLNRQNYLSTDIGNNKARVLKNLMESINPKVKVNALERFLNKEDLEILIPQHDFVINSIDFDAEEFFICHQECIKNEKIEFFPMNLGFGTGLFVFDKVGFPHVPNVKREMINYIINSQKGTDYIRERISHYFSQKREYDPQLGVGTYSTAALVTTLIIKHLNNEKIKFFPECYLIDLNSL